MNCFCTRVNYVFLHHILAPQEYGEGNDVRKQQGGLQQQKLAVIEDSDGNILTESTAVLNRWTEYCSGLYNYEPHPDKSLLQSNQTPTQELESLPVLREEVEEAVRSLKAGKSHGVDNIPSELRKNGDKATTTFLTAICKKIWETNE